MRWWDTSPSPELAETQRRLQRSLSPDTRSARLAQRLGFRPEGLLRDRLFVGGEPRSLQMYALLPPDWRG